jgi:hypothetical protein
MTQFGASLIDDSRVIMYDFNIPQEPIFYNFFAIIGSDKCINDGKFTSILG